MEEKGRVFIAGGRCCDATATANIFLFQLRAATDLWQLPASMARTRLDPFFVVVVVSLSLPR